MWIGDAETDAHIVQVHEKAAQPLLPLQWPLSILEQNPLDIPGTPWDIQLDPREIRGTESRALAGQERLCKSRRQVLHSIVSARRRV